MKHYQRRTLATQITDYLTRNKISRSKFCSMIINNGGNEVSERTVYKWENGENIPGLENVIAISKILEMSLDELLAPDTPTLNVIREFSKETKKLLNFLLANHSTLYYRLSASESDWLVNFSKPYTYTQAKTEYEEKLKTIFIRERLKSFCKANANAQNLSSEELFNYINVSVLPAEGDEETALYPLNNENIAYYAEIQSCNLPDDVKFSETGFFQQSDADSSNTNNINFDFLAISNLPTVERNNELKKLNSVLNEAINKSFSELIQNGIIDVEKIQKSIFEFVDVSNDQRLESCIMDFIELYIPLNLTDEEKIEFLKIQSDKQIEKLIRED